MSQKLNYIFFTLATLVSVALRTAMLFFTIDTKSGFLKTEYLFFGGAILAVIALAAVLTFVFSYLAKPQFDPETPKNRVFRLCTALLALVILYDTFFTNIASNAVSWQKAAEAVLAIIAAVALIVFAAKDEDSTPLPPVLNVVPVLYWFIRLIIVFANISTLANIPDNIFELVSLCLILISALWCAKVACIGIEEKRRGLLSAILMTTVFSCFVTAIPRGIAILSGNEALLHKTGIPIMTTLVSGFYFLVFALSNILSKNK